MVWPLFVVLRAVLALHLFKSAQLEMDCANRSGGDGVAICCVRIRARANAIHLRNFKDFPVS